MSKYGFKKNDYNVYRTRRGSSPRRRSSSSSSGLGNIIANALTDLIFKRKK